ncbi:phosphatase PAP2 family protein [Povalibacter sp.]|uniref:phosphatase PAP2 family protein n=1 Tax=Povalibacter sp. TaxID=1962978 RepID=UPI002F40ED91
MNRSTCVSRASFVLLCCSITGCATLPNGRDWGEDATIAPGWDRVRSAATIAAKDPWVWAPLVGAAVFQIDDWDRRTSDWARDHTPVFGSQRNAENWSDDLRNASALAHYITIAATPSGPDAGDWLVNKAKGTLVGIAAVSSTVLVTNGLKDVADRERPNGDDSASFPSGHTSASAVHTRLASRNLQSIDMSDGWRGAADAGLTALTLGTSWARIEAGWHYPSDTLVGMAIGNFLASFFNDAFLGLEQGSGTSLAMQAADGGATLQWRLRF